MRKALLFLSACLTMALSWQSSPAAPMESTQPDSLVDTQFLRDYAVTRGFSLGRPAKPKPTPDGKAVIFLRTPPRTPQQRLYTFDVATGKTQELLSPEEVLAGKEEVLSPEEKARRERQRVSTKGFTDYDLSKDGSKLLVSLSGRLYTIERTSHKVQALPTGKGILLDPKFSPDSKSVSYVLDNDLYVMDLASLQERPVTQGGTDLVTHGLAEFVAQEEMGRFTGYWWSPDAQWLAYEEADAHSVEVWRVADPAKPNEEAYTQPYPRPGKENVKVRLGIIPAQGAATTWIDWDRERYPYLATVKWDKGGPLTILVQDRRQQEMVLLTVNPQTGKTTPLLTETDSAWLNLDQDVPHWLKDGSGFLWISEHSGVPQLELRDPRGTLVRVLAGSDVGFALNLGAEGGLEVDDADGMVYFQGGPDPTQTQVYQVPIAGGPPVPLTQEMGQHEIVFAENHTVYVRRSNTPRTLTRTTVHRSDGTLIGELPSEAEESTLIPNTEFVKVGAGTGFYTSVLRPRDFDPRQKYPVVVSVYAGPGAQRVVAAMRNQLLDQWLANQGFIVVAIDGRGTPRRGRDWERVLRYKFGSVPLEDQVAGLKALGAKYPEMDLNRVGITGWSYGGYMSALAVLKEPDIFKAAVAGAPVTDWLDYDTHYTERFLGLPQEHPQAYAEGSLLTYAPNLQRPLLLVHGTSDDNVFFLHTLKLSEALFRAGKDHEVLPLNGFTHMVPDPLVRERLQERIARFFRQHL
ncbi:S9 family peptidase [Anthocerotibacter panamensis]|uniref:S9 family peptidase n=1 Tax=Anthocerotibacter panamensis TaxID=2857077 RepID=UPI001C407AF4|nr:S9 family peptidase [Anthocerotibacter panamensis]